MLGGMGFVWMVARYLIRLVVMSVILELTWDMHVPDKGGA